MADRFPKDCWEKNCPHFHTRDLSIDDLVCTCDLLKISCDACDEDFSLSLCPLPNEPKERGGEAREKEFDYGIVVYKHRFNMTRSLDDYKETTINKCIRIGLELKYKTMYRDKLVYEMQIVYKDENDILQCLCLDLHDWTIAIKHIGNMQCNL